ncbi:hypothetical protein E1A91_D09G038200v1 [Gossypium mustelinum]|uniref:Uncharacterized protein n=2 Tax=Gossypium TaxID=3633 RepID=A0A5D2TF92_GOSMU|nr:hypothetical protein ES332_D09G039200v1 [Gossypium tomentosum]TYI63749.1 hypothetical protein E1A91_D09G038200v1 [Gossypium mustelinum]
MDPLATVSEELAEIDGQFLLKGYVIYEIQENFVWQITIYFMELATPHTEEVIKLVDKVGDFEWLIQKSPLS